MLRAASSTFSEPGLEDREADQANDNERGDDDEDGAFEARDGKRHDETK